jgi:hypothetical protein
MKKIYLVLISILMLGTIQNAFSQITGDTSICTGDAATYYAGAIPGGGYTWTVVGGNIVGPANADSVVISWGIPGTGSLFVTVTIPNSPPQSYFVNLFIHPKPSPKITHAPYPTCPTEGGEQGAGTSPDQHGKDNCENVCKYATVTYTTTSNPGSTYFWVVNGEVIFIGQNTNAVTVTWDSTAFGSVTVYETNQWGCSDSSTH